MKKILYYISAIILVQILLFFLKNQPELIESYYSTRFYLALHTILTYATKRITTSVGDVIYLLIVLAIFIKLIQYIKSGKNIFKKIVGYLLEITFLFIFFFQIFWGLNNLRIPTHEKLKIETRYELSDLNKLTEKLIKTTNALQYQITQNDSAKISFKKDLKAFNQAARNGYKNLEDAFDIAIVQHNDVKKSLFSNFLTGAGFSGYLNPFTHEAQVNYEVPVVGMPVTVAHEIAHQKGIASESEANFFGFLAMKNQDKIEFKYAADLYALKYCLKEVRMNDEELFKTYFEQLNFGVKENIIESEKFWEENKNFSSGIFKNVYGNFLKMNNQKDGIKSYNRFVDLLINYDKREEF